jgi:hypothetical protein
MKLELKDLEDNLIEVVEIDDYVWGRLQAIAKEKNISEEQLFNIIFTECARKCDEE